MERLKVLGAQLVSSLETALQDLAAYLPVILIAIALIVAGWLLARVLRNLSHRAIERLDWLFRRATSKTAQDGTGLQQAAARAVSAVVFWTVLLSFVAAALRSLGWPVVEAWTGDLLAYLPVLVGGLAIILAGFIGGAVARNILEPAAASVGVTNSALFGRLSQAAIIVTGLIVGTGHLGIDVSFVVQLTTVIVGVSFAGIALALALGMREHLSNLISIRYVRKHYQLGERVRAGDYQGTITAIADGCVFLETEDGDVSLPGQYFAQQPLTKLTDDAPT